MTDLQTALELIERIEKGVGHECCVKLLRRKNLLIISASILIANESYSLERYFSKIEIENVYFDLTERFIYEAKNLFENKIKNLKEGKS